MKVLQIIPIFKLAGAETMCENLCYTLQDQSCKVTAVSLYTEQTPITDRLTRAGVNVVYLDKKPGLDISIFIKLYKLMKKEKPDAVHTHIGAARYAQPVAALCGVPARVHTVHSIAQQEQSTAGKIANKYMFRYCNVVPVALSEEVKKTVEAVYKLPEQKIPVVFNEIDLSKCQVKTDYSRKDFFKILHIGRFTDVKNHILILNGFAQFAKHHPEARLQLLGEGELWDETKKLAQTLQIADKVDFAGLQDNVAPWLYDADLFILPSKYEGMPMTLIEAMGTGLPIVASAVGGIPDMLTDHYDALLIDPSAEALYSAIEELYSDVSLRINLGTRARARSKSFSSKTMAEQYLNLYKTQMNEEGRV